MKKTLFLFGLFFIFSFVFFINFVSADEETILSFRGDRESIPSSFGDAQSSFLSSPPATATGGTPAVQGSHGGGSSRSTTILQCVQNSDCASDEVCLENECVKLFDIKILDFQSPVKLGDFFTFTYFIKGMANISTDVTIDFWIENNGKKVASGSDVIYMGNFEQKIETTKLFLPSNLESGAYLFYVRVTHPSYSAESYRTIEVQVKEGVAEINFTDTEIKSPTAPALITITLILTLLIFFERSEIDSLLTKGAMEINKEVRKIKG